MAHTEIKNLNDQPECKYLYSNVCLMLRTEYHSDFVVHLNATFRNHFTYGWPKGSHGLQLKTFVRMHLHSRSLSRTSGSPVQLQQSWLAVNRLKLLLRQGPNILDKIWIICLAMLKFLEDQITSYGIFPSTSHVRSVTVTILNFLYDGSKKQFIVANTWKWLGKAA